MDSIYNKVLSEYYGINCNNNNNNSNSSNCSKELIDIFLLELIIKNLNISKQCQVNLLTQLA